MTSRASLRVLLVTLPAVALLFGLSPIGAQSQSSGDHAAHFKAWDAHESLTKSSPYKAMNWSYIGPTNISGRFSDVAVAVRGSSQRIYAGSCCGGVWASDDDGQTWQVVFDKEASTATGAPHEYTVCGVNAPVPRSPWQSGLFVQPSPTCKR